MNKQRTIDIIKELGLDGLPEEEKDNLISSMAEALQMKITNRVMEVLMPEERKEMDKLVAAGDEQKVEAYVVAKVPGLDSIAREEAIKFRDELLSSNEMLKEEMAKKKQS